jgi:DNA-binding transcriptional ArsR family regulator
MPKSNFLLVDLNESKTKKLAETITSITSRKILNHLAEKDHDTEKNIATTLSIPISTVHYHLQKLTEAKLLEVKEFHYSQKGREVNHYKLANKYIIIAPKKVSGLREKLQGILPVALTALGISAIIKIFQTKSFGQEAAFVSDSLAKATESAPMALAQELPEVATQTISQQPDIAVWFLLGSFVTLVLYLLTSIVKEYIKNKK